MTLLVFIFCFAWLANANDVCQEIEFAKTKVTFDPSPDVRAKGHIIYYRHVEADTEYNSGAIPIGTNEFVIEKGKLWPGNTYIFTATAYSDNMESDRSAPLKVCVKDLPPFTPPEKKEPASWLKVILPKLLKAILGN